MGLEPAARLRAFAEGLLAGRIIPFLGAGASSYAGNSHTAYPPTGAELLRLLAAEAELAVNCDGECGRPIYDLARVASYYQLVTESRRELDRRLTELIGDQACTPNGLHRLLARVAKDRPMLVITTNYDALLETAFDDEQAPYEVVATAADRLAYRGSDDDDDDDAPDDLGMIYHRVGGGAGFHPLDPRELCPDLAVRSIIYKVHGSVPKGNAWSGGYLIAEEDYTRFLGRMDRNYIYPIGIKTIMRAKERLPGGRGALVHSLLFLGYSLNDWNLRVLMDELGIGQGLPGEERHYAILKTGDQVARELLSKRNIAVRIEDLNVFVPQLNEAITALRVPPPARIPA